MERISWPDTVFSSRLTVEWEDVTSERGKRLADPRPYTSPEYVGAHHDGRLTLVSLPRGKLVES